MEGHVEHTDWLWRRSILGPTDASENWGAVGIVLVWDADAFHFMRWGVSLSVGEVVMFAELLEMWNEVIACWLRRKGELLDTYISLSTALFLDTSDVLTCST